MGEALDANESNLLQFCFFGPTSPQIAAVALSLKTPVATSLSGSAFALRPIKRSGDQSYGFSPQVFFSKETRSDPFSNASKCSGFY